MLDNDELFCIRQSDLNSADERMFNAPRIFEYYLLEFYLFKSLYISL